MTARGIAELKIVTRWKSTGNKILPENQLIAWELHAPAFSLPPGKIQYFSQKQHLKPLRWYADTENDGDRNRNFFINYYTTGCRGVTKNNNQK